MTEPAFTRGGPEVLFTGRYISAAGRKYDISPDGQQFLMVMEARQRDDTSALTQSSQRKLHLKNIPADIALMDGFMAFVRKALHLSKISRKYCETLMFACL